MDSGLEHWGTLKEGGGVGLRDSGDNNVCSEKTVGDTDLE